jgi:hypothetical protein
MVITGGLAVLLIPAASLTRERQRARCAMDALLQAREDAIRSVAMAERERAAASQTEARIVTSNDQAIVPNLGRDEAAPSPEAATTLKCLQRENAELRNTVEMLRLEIKRLKVQQCR